MWSKALKTQFNEFIFSSILTVGPNVYSGMYSCTDVFNCLSTVGEQISLEHLPMVGSASVVFSD